MAMEDKTEDVLQAIGGLLATGRTFFSMREIAKAARVDKMTAVRAVTRLEVEGKIGVKHSTTKGLANAYTLLHTASHTDRIQGIAYSKVVKEVIPSSKETTRDRSTMSMRSEPSTERQDPVQPSTESVPALRSSESSAPAPQGPGFPDGYYLTLNPEQSDSTVKVFGNLARTTLRVTVDRQTDRIAVSLTDVETADVPGDPDAFYYDEEFLIGSYARGNREAAPLLDPRKLRGTVLENFVRNSTRLFRLHRTRHRMTAGQFSEWFEDHGKNCGLQIDGQAQVREILRTLAA